MKRAFRKLTFFVVIAVLFTACQKFDWYSHGGGGNPSKQAGDYSSEAGQKWIQLQLRIIQSNPALPVFNGVLMGYAGLTLYESVVPGIPAFQSIAKQLNGSPTMPSIEQGKKYHWPSSANAAMATIIRSLYANASAELKASVDSLENALNTAYQADISAEIVQRSAGFGKAVAQAVFDWSKTDGSYDVHPAYVPPVGPGLWAPTPPANVPAIQPYLGSHRTFVKGSLNGTQPPPPPAYSEAPSSDFYKAVKEVYDVSQTLTAAETAQAIYYRDTPGYQGGGGAYLYIFYQILKAENPKLDWAAIAYAKVGISLADALVGCWQEKYKYNVQRPIKYIREVLGHPDWNPVFPTPPHPDYPSGHSTAGGAIEEALTGLLGNHYAFTNHAYDYLGMPPQAYSSFEDMAKQIGRSRVLAGIHYTISCDNGRTQGKQIARNVEKGIRFHK